MFSYKGRFLKNNQRLFDQAREAMFAILSKFRSSMVILLPYDIQLELFDTLVAPILLYRSEVTGLKFVKLQYVSSGFRCRVITGSLIRLY